MIALSKAPLRTVADVPITAILPFFVAFVAAFAYQLVRMLHSDLLAVFIVGFAQHSGVFDLFTLHFGELVALRIIEEEVFEVVLVIVPFGHYYLGVAESGMYIFTMQALLVQVLQ